MPNDVLFNQSVEVRIDRPANKNDINTRSNNMEALAIVTALALIQAVLFAFQVGSARVKHGISAPAVSGHDEFERHYRVHQNTMEQLIVFLPALWMFGYFIHPYWGAGIGLVFVASRFMYQRAYIKDPKSRSGAFGVGFMTMAILLLGSIVGAVMRLVSSMQ
jgi:glutathione S-transferase